MAIPTNKEELRQAVEINYNSTRADKDTGIGRARKRNKDEYQ